MEVTDGTGSKIDVTQETDHFSRPQANGIRLTRRRTLTSLAALAGILVLATGAHSQGSQARPTGPAPENATQQPPEATIHLRVALVNAPVVVTDTNGEPVLDLEKSSFRVLDNGVEQTIEALDLGGEPLSVVFVFETSSCVAPVLSTVRKSAVVFTQTIVGPSGEAAILSYDSTSQRLLPFTTEHEKLEETISSLKAGASGTRLYDTLSHAVVLLSDRPQQRRRAIVVVGEARDDRSEKKLGEVLRQAQLANVVIYSVGLSPTAAALHSGSSQASPIQTTPSGTFSGPPFPGSAQTPTNQQQYAGNIDLLGLAEWAVRNTTAVVKDHPLELTAAATGGTFQSVVRERTLEKAVDAIGGELNSQYTLSYRPTVSDVAGYHKINVTVDRPGTKVRTRPGYYLEVESGLH
jgi:VWFA-related protein